MPELTLDLHDLDPAVVARVIESVDSVDGVEEIRPGQASVGPDRYKGLGTDVVVKLTGEVLPAVVRRLAEALRALFGLPGGPEEVSITVGTPHGPASFTYDPRHTTLEEAVSQMLRLVGRPDPARG